MVTKALARDEFAVFWSVLLGREFRFARAFRCRRAEVEPNETKPNCIGHDGRVFADERKPAKNCFEIGAIGQRRLR